MTVICVFLEYILYIWHLSKSRERKKQKSISGVVMETYTNSLRFKNTDHID